MKIKDQLQTAQSNVLRAKTRTFLTVLAIVIGTALISTTTGVSQGMWLYFDKQTRAYAQPSDLIVRKAPQEGQLNESRNADENLTEADLPFIRTLPGVVGAELEFRIQPFLFLVNGKTFHLADPSTLFPGERLGLAAGTQPAADDPSKIMIPYPALKFLGIAKPEDALGRQVQIILRSRNQKGTNLNSPSSEPSEKTIDLTIAAVLLNSVNSQKLFISYRLARDIAIFQRGIADSLNAYAIIAQLKPNLTDSQITELKGELSRKGYRGISYADQIGGKQMAIDLATVIMDGLAGVALLVAMIGIVNTLLMAVLERVKEIGLLKALGSTRAEIFALFAYEAIAIGFWGGLLGVLLSMLLIGPIANIYVAHFQRGNGFELYFPWQYMVAIVIGSSAIGFLAGVAPAIRASNLDPVQALRRE